MNNIKDEHYYIPVRLSHFLTHASVGAIVRNEDYLAVIQDIRFWKKKGEIIPYVEQVKAALGITEELRIPPVGELKQEDYPQQLKITGAVVPATIFPRWTRCLKCGLLHFSPWKSPYDRTYLKPQELICKSCHGKLQQVNFVSVHAKGYLSDIDWHYLTHLNTTNPEQKQCGRQIQQPYLKLVEQNGRYKLICTHCHVESYFHPSSFGANKIKYVFKGYLQPWLRSEKHSNPEELESAELIEINDTRLHSTVSSRALVIPPESRVRRGSVVDHLYSSRERLLRLEKARNPHQRKIELGKLARDLHCEVDDIEAALAQIHNGYPLFGQNFTLGQLLEQEYTAFLTEINDLHDDEDFIPRHLTAEWKALLNQPLPDIGKKVLRLIDDVISVERLKEIWVMRGFQRKLNEENDKSYIVPPDIVGETNWLPALELYGEGIFISFNQDILQQWEKHEEVRKRAEEFKTRFMNSGITASQLNGEEIEVTPRFLLLHALAHKIIKELESQAGYPAASIRERIYCSMNPDAPMAGILVYVTTTDILGTLGGIAELAEPKRLLKLLVRSFEAANWCSLDPICAENEGQGPAELNRAACHSCELLPETSCICGNILLDRTFIKGNTKFPSILDCID